MSEVNVNLQPPPTETPFLENDKFGKPTGKVSQQWVWFLRNLVLRLGVGSNNNINDVIITAEGSDLVAQYGEAGISSNQVYDELTQAQLASLYEINLQPGVFFDADQSNLIWALSEENPGALYQWIKDTINKLKEKGSLITSDGQDNIEFFVGTDTQVLTADSTTASGLIWKNSGKVQIRFDYGDATPKPIYLIDADIVIIEARIIILTEFDDATATLSLGDAGDVNRLIATTDNRPYEIGSYKTDPGTKYGSATQINLLITPSTSTQGSGLVVITYEI